MNAIFHNDSCIEKGLYKHV